MSDPNTEQTEIPMVDSTSVDFGENSKTIYFNDSFELDEIPLDTDSIIDMNDNEELL